MTETTPQAGAGFANGTNGTRRRILKGAAAIAPAIITMQSSSGWAASSCGEVLDANFDTLTSGRLDDATASQIQALEDNLEKDILDPIGNSGGFMVSSRCLTSFNSPS